ncbi:MAG: hypothetical protein ACXAAI_00825 [Promethearchaeota archaeon]
MKDESVICENCGENTSSEILECEDCSNHLCDVCVNICQKCGDNLCDSCYQEHNISCTR